MKSLFFVASALVTMQASAEDFPHIASCLEQDTIEIVDDGPGKAIVTYYNSIENCSSPVTIRIKSDNGIEVRITIGLGNKETGLGETIILEPTDPMMMAFPPEEYVLDGETKQYVIMGGMS